MAFKLHRFLSGAGHVYATLRSAPHRRVTLDGQRFDPGDEEARLYPTFFCRNCGQEHHPVVLVGTTGDRAACCRATLTRRRWMIPTRSEKPGYLMPEPENDEAYSFTGAPEDYPEEWIETSSQRQHPVAQRSPCPCGQELTVDATGIVGTTGRRAWFLPGKFRLCPACGHQPPVQAREINKVASLSAEGRSSATTLLVSSALRWMKRRRGIAGRTAQAARFTDNRQDAALQAGHFNDFLFVALLRAATLAAVRAAGSEGLSEDQFGHTPAGNAWVSRLPSASDERSGCSIPRSEALLRSRPSARLARVLAHRAWVDQRRGWRFTNPNLEELGLVRADYLSLDDLAADDDAFANAPPELRTAAPATRRKALRILLDHLRHGLAITTDALDPGNVEAIANASRQSLREPWSISQQEEPRVAAALIIRCPET